MEEYEIEYDAQAAEEMEQEAETYAVVLTQEQLDALIETAGKVAAEYTMQAMQDHAEKKAAESKRERQKQIKQMLKSYRSMKTMVEEEMRFDFDEQRRIRWKFLSDIVGDPANFDRKSEDYINSFENRRNETVYLLWKVETAVMLYASDVEAGTEEDRRRLETLKLMYIYDKPMTIAEIAEKQQIAENTVYKDLRIASETLEKYLY